MCTCSCVGAELSQAKQDAPRDDRDLAQLVKERMDNIKRLEKLKRDFSSAAASAPPAPSTSKEGIPTGVAPISGQGKDPSRPVTPIITRSAAAQRAYELLRADREADVAEKEMRGAKRVSRWGEEDEDEDGDLGDEDDEQGVRSVMGRGRMVVEEDVEDVEDVEEEEEDEWDDFDREFDDDAWDEKDDGASAAQVHACVRAHVPSPVLRHSAPVPDVPSALPYTHVVVGPRDHRSMLRACRQAN